jgi:hypothetical protein
MEYLIGSMVTLVSIFFANRLIAKQLVKHRPAQVLFSQSQIHEVLAPFLPTNQELKSLIVKTQSSNHYKKNSMRVMFLEDKAYWIKDNAFFTANVFDGIIDEESTSRVDIMGMDDVQLKEMSFIVDKLTEGIDDENRYSGK